MKTRIVSAVLFALILLSLPLITAFTPKISFSDIENRVLAEWPKATVRSIKTRTFMDGVEDYFSDHFFGRDTWVTAKGYLEYYSGKRENNGVYICDNRLIEDISEPDDEKTKKNIDAIKAFVEKNKKPTFLMLVPTAAEIYRSELPYGAQTWDQRKYIKDICKQLSGIANEIDIYKVLYENKSEYLYYRTDHHWTTNGAFFAFTEVSERMGIHAAYMKSYNLENVSHNFFGTLYSKVGYRGIDPDIISIYSKRGSTLTQKVEVFDGKQTNTFDSMYFKDFLSKKDQYSVFLGQNQPIINITTSSSNQKSIVIFKDSFANSFVPLLADYYSKITLVDLRYINEGYDKLIDIGNFDQVLLLYNVDSFGQSTDISKLGVS